jgi:cyclin-dependent kinase
MAQAKRVETEAFDTATSKVSYMPSTKGGKNFSTETYPIQNAYDSICQRAIDEAELASSKKLVTSNLQHVADNDEDPETSTRQVIGQYRSCFDHYAGLHSSIYRSKMEDGTVRAVKVTIPHMMTAPHDAHREARLLREASHDHIIPLIETFNLDGGRFVLVFPFVRYDFEQLLRRDMVTAAQTRSILRDLFHALTHLHSMGILHRDIKPSNILMNTPNGPAYLADFGVSWKEDDTGSEPHTQKITDVGTTCYRPPEILFGFKEYGTSLDMWAAGCVVAEAIAVGHQQLFDSGPVGSDLSLIFSIFKLLGTPDEQRWPVSFTSRRNGKVIINHVTGSEGLARLGKSGIPFFPHAAMG